MKRLENDLPAFTLSNSVLKHCEIFFTIAHKPGEKVPLTLTGEKKETTSKEERKSAQQHVTRTLSLFVKTLPVSLLGGHFLHP